MGGQRGRSGGKRRGAGRRPLSPAQKWLRGGTGPRPIEVEGTSPPVEELEEESEPGEAPAHWRPAVRAWYAAIVEDWELSAAGLQLLQHAGECLNLEAACRDVIARDGLLMPYGSHFKAHPLLATAAQARGAFLTLLATLGLTK